MPKKLDSKKRIGNGGPYPWDMWFSMQAVYLKQGEDFQASVKGMVDMVRHAARDRGLRVAIRSLADGVEVRVKKSYPTGNKTPRGKANAKGATKPKTKGRKTTTAAR